MLHAQLSLVQDPQHQRHARHHTDDSPAAALREKQRHHDRQRDADKRAHVSQTDTSADYDGENRQQVTEVLQVVQKRVPTTKLPASPRRGPTLLAHVISHLKYVEVARDRKSTRLNSSHSQISYAVFCLKKKNKE